MKKQIKAILIVLLFVVLMDPIKVSAFSYDISPLYKGIYVEIIDCDGSKDYYIDVIVLKEEVDQKITEMGGAYSYPSVIDTNGYGNFNNEWISLSKFYEPGPTIREVCVVNFYGDLEDFEDIPYSEYRVVVYEDNEMIGASDSFLIENISYGDYLGNLILFNSYDNEMYEEMMYEDPDSFEPFSFMDLILILVIPVLVVGGLAFVFGEPLIYFSIPRLREHTWWVLLYNTILVVIVTIAFFVVRQIGNVEPRFILPIVIVVLSFGVMLVKVKHLSQMEFQAMVPTKIVSYGYLAMWAIYFLLVSLV